MCEACARFGIALDEMKRKPVDRRAEMMAFILLEEARNNFIKHLEAEAIKAREKAKTGYNPAEAQMRKWMTE